MNCIGTKQVIRGADTQHMALASHDGHCAAAIGMRRVSMRQLRVHGPWTSTSRRRHAIIQAASKQDAVTPPPPPAGQQPYVEEQQLRIERVSFGSILTPVGLGLLVYGFGAFFQLLPGGDVSSLLLIYGFPISLLGFALSYAQLKPVPCFSTPEALTVRESQATDIQNQLRDDVTRFRYGDEQHLDEALSRIFKFGQPGGLARRLCPILIAVREELRNNMYTLVLDFETKKEQMGVEEWENRKEKIQSFFGPGIVVELMPTDRGEEVALIVDGSGAGRGGSEKKDVLPPLMPGMAPRQQQ